MSETQRYISRDPKLLTMKERAKKRKISLRQARKEHRAYVLRAKRDRKRWANRTTLLRLERKQRSEEGARVFSEYIQALRESTQILKESWTLLGKNMDDYWETSASSRREVLAYAKGFNEGKEAAKQESKDSRSFTSAETVGRIAV